jgi:molecular chaperone Hsp33
MSQSDNFLPTDSSLSLDTQFVRGRNVLLASADFSPLFVDYYLHLASHELRPQSEHDTLFKELLAAFVLHLASRPRNEFLGWTLSFQQFGINVFLGGDTADGAVAGRVFTEHQRPDACNAFYQQLVVRGREPRQSHVSFAGGDPLAAVEAFYAGSEQRPARLFRLGGDRFALLGAHPDFDESWFRTVTADDVAQLAASETLVVLERRTFRWECGCNESRIFQVLEPLMRDQAADLFGDDPSIVVNCPRCAGRYRVSRQQMEAWLARPQS